LRSTKGSFRETGVQKARTTETDSGQVTRRQVLKGLLGGVAAAVPACTSEKLASDRESRSLPNIVFICSDQHHPRLSGFRGAPFIVTPNLDQLASEGTYFSNTYCTSPICSPSRYSLMTGKYVHQTRTWMIGVPISRGEQTWVRHLTELGYETSSYGKMDFCGEYQNPGFQEFVTYLERRSLNPYPRKEPLPQRLKGYRRPGKRSLIESSHVTEDGIHTLVEENGKHYVEEFHFRDQRMLGFGPHDRQVTDRGLARIREAGRANGSKPFALYLGYLQPHWPFVAPRELFESYYPDRISWPHDALFPNNKLHPALREFQQVMCLDGLGREDLRRTIALYYGMVTYLDRMIGEIIEELKRQGLYDNTYIIYTSDHGESLGEHGLFYKECSYESSVGVPLIVKGPEIPPAGRIELPVSLVDIYPTILQMAHLAPEPDRPGHSLIPMANGITEGYPEHVFAEFHANMIRPSWYMIRDQRYKYTYYTNRFDPSLFDLKEDPLEQHDLSRDLGQSSRLEEYRARLNSICDPEKTSLYSKADLGLIGPNGEDFTESLTID